MDVVQPCNAKKNGICWYWALQCPQKIFAIFFAKMAKTILHLWPDFALTADAPSLYPSPPPPLHTLLPLKNKSKQSTKEIQKKVSDKKFYIVKFKSVSWSLCKKKIIVKLEKDFFCNKKYIRNWTFQENL